VAGASGKARALLIPALQVPINTITNSRPLRSSPGAAKP